MDLVKKVKALYPNKFVRFGSGFSVSGADCSDCGDCNSRYMYNYHWVNKEGYGTTAWAPTLTTVSQNFGMNGNDFIVTYL
jgi:hypothetical protein